VCSSDLLEDAIVDLGAPMPIDLVVARGCRDACRVETSADLRTWRFVGSTDAERAAFAIASHRRARYVRVSGPFVDALTEISAWSGQPVVPAASLLVSPEAFRTKHGTSGSVSTRPTRARGFTWWAVIAAALIGAVGGAVAMLLVRKRRAA